MPYVRINNQEIFFEDSGGTKLPIVMLHGFLMDQRMFDHQVRVLAPDYRCIRFDARAFGKTKWDKLAFNLYDTVADCVGLLDHLGLESAVICGMSQGGYAALRMAIKYPHRVRALVLMSTQAGVDDEKTKAQYCQLRDTWCEYGPIDPLMEGLATALLGPRNNENMADHWDKWLPVWKLYAKNAIYCGMNNLLERDDISLQLSQIPHATLITHGEQDYGMPIEHGYFLQQHLKNCFDLVAIPGAAHAANYTHPALINEAMARFFRSLA